MQAVTDYGSVDQLITSIKGCRWKGGGSIHENKAQIAMSFFLEKISGLAKNDKHKTLHRVRDQ